MADPTETPHRPSDEEHDKGPEYAGQDARQGEIILRNRARRLIFIAGLVGLVGLALIARCAGYV